STLKKLGKCSGLALLAWTLFLPRQAVCDSIVVPNNYANLEGASNNALPFDIAAQSLASARYEQVYDAGQFASIPGGRYITQILFRPDTGIHGSPFSSTPLFVYIVLSTTPMPVDGLNATFGNNIGPDAQTVYFGTLPLSSGFSGPANGPKAFDIVVNLTEPFFYNPAHGNLLMDVWNYTSGSTTYFDAVLGGPTSRAYSLTGVGASTGLTDGLGLVTRFTVTSPRLSYSSKPGSLILSWPTVLAGWQLQSAPSPTGLWTAYTNSIQIQGASNIAVIPTTSTHQFFRLHYP
ncbi:MAG TPA: hypothetical protein VN281_06520, partial [Verrucomicrobiae bacterium]|nr:hypothetical protein [Verrucomicrobiae bacterium]